MKRERGFTLIELLVVIAIMAVLFGVTALALSGLPTGKTESMGAEKDVVQTAIDVWLTQNDTVLAASPAGDAAAVSASTLGFGLPIAS